MIASVGTLFTAETGLHTTACPSGDEGMTCQKTSGRDNVRCMAEARARVRSHVLHCRGVARLLVRLPHCLATAVALLFLGAMWDVGSFLLYANAYHELGAVNRREGDKVVVRVQWLPGRKVSHAKTN
jgi:hypothetical protein